MSKLFCTPYSTSVNILDPPPSLAGSSEAPTNLPPGANACAERCPGSREALQEVKMCFKVFVRQIGAPAHSRHFVLGFTVQDCFACHIAYLNVTQSRSGPRYRATKTWEVKFDPTSCLRVAASDGGPRFCSPLMADLEIGESPEVDGNIHVYDCGSLKLACTPEDTCVRWRFETDDENFSEYVVLRFTLGVQRRVPKQEWTRLHCKKVPEPKSTLLESAKQTGDVILVGGVSDGLCFPLV